MYPQQTPPGLTIRTSYPWIAFMLALFKPKALINGHEVALTWGDNHIPAPPGVHQITIWVPYLWKVGTATISVDNTQGGAQVFYAAPSIVFMGGAIGQQPVKSPGMLASILLMVVPLVLLILCCCGGSLLGGMDS